MDEQGSEWVAFIAKELDREYDRRDRLNTRSATTITSATTLLTVSLAVVAVLKGQHFAVSGILKVGFLLGAVVLLLAAAVLSILAGATRSRFEVAPLNRLIEHCMGTRHAVCLRLLTGVEWDGISTSHDEGVVCCGR